MWRAGLAVGGLLVACRFDEGGVPATGAPVDAPVTGVADARDIDGAIDATNDVPADAGIDATACPGGYQDFGVPGSRYRVVIPPQPWLNAEADCENDGATTHLLVMNDEAERLAVAPRRPEVAWIGISDRVDEGDYAVVTGAVATFLPWRTGEPNDAFNFDAEDCVELEGNGFNDELCTDGNAYICECDALPADPSSYTPD